MFAAKNHEPSKTKAEKPSAQVNAKGETAQRVQVNPFWNQLATRVQPKLTVGAPDDPYEREADQIADEVMRMPDSSSNTPALSFTSIAASTAQRKCSACEEEDKLQRKRSVNTAIPLRISALTVPVQRKYTHCEENQNPTKADGDSQHLMHNIESRLVATKADGRPMPNDAKTEMESAFGTDFSDVRVHTGRDAVQLSQALNAYAFTHGSDVYFNEGKYNPYSTEGMRLLAHELAHTVQQNKGEKSIQKQEATGGCGVCRDEDGYNKFLKIGTEAHRIIQQQFETDHIINGHLLTSTEETIRDSKGDARRIDLVYKYKNTKNKFAIGEIKPPLGNDEGLAQIQLYKKLLSEKYHTFEIENLRVSIDDRGLVFPNPKAIRCPEQYLKVKPTNSGVYIYDCKPPWSVLKDECKCKKAPVDTLICGVRDRGEIDEFAANAQRGALTLFEQILRPEVEIFIDKLTRFSLSALEEFLPFATSYVFGEPIEKRIKVQLRVLAYELAESVRNNVRRIIVDIIDELCFFGRALGLVVSLKEVLEVLRRRIQDFILGELVDLVLQAASAALKAIREAVAEAVIVAALAVIVIALLPEAIAGLGVSSLYAGSVAALESLGPALTVRALQLVTDF